MRESRLYGFVRGARGNLRPYRDVRLSLYARCRTLLSAESGTWATMQSRHGGCVR